MLQSKSWFYKLCLELKNTLINMWGIPLWRLSFSHQALVHSDNKTLQEFRWTIPLLEWTPEAACRPHLLTRQLTAAKSSDRLMRFLSPVPVFGPACATQTGLVWKWVVRIISVSFSVNLAGIWVWNLEPEESWPPAPSNLSNRRHSNVACLSLMLQTSLVFQ